MMECIKDGEVISDEVLAANRMSRATFTNIKWFI